MDDPDLASAAEQGDRADLSGLAAAAGREGDEKSGASVNIAAEAGEVEGDFNVAETINQLLLPDRPRLSLGHFERYNEHQVAEQARRVIASPQVITGWAASIERFRLLFLVGAAESGKATLAWRLAAQLGERHPCRELLLCRHSLVRNVQVRFEDFARSRYAGTVIVLRDALASDNVDLTRFVRTLDEARLSALAAKLGASNVFVVLTAEGATLADAEAKLRGLGVLAEVAPLPGDLLGEGLAQLARRLPAFAEGTQELRDAVQRLLAEQGTPIAARLGTMPRIARFVQEALVEVAAGRVKLEHALEHADDLQSWLLRDLPQDFEAWCYALALALCYAAAQPGRLSWTQFDRFREELTRYLERRLRRGRTERAPAVLCHGFVHCQSARAEIAQPVFPEVCTVRFRDEGYPRRLWEILLGPGKSLLGLIRPLLSTLASAKEPFLRDLSTQIVGRMGELAPLDLVLPLIERDGVPLGALFRGILSSADEGYRLRCMQQLRAAMIGRRPDLSRKAVAALIVIGQVDLRMALAELRALCTGELSPAIDREVLARAVAGLEERAPENPDARQLLVQLQRGNPRGLLTKILPARLFALVDSVRFTLVGLCVARGPIEVLAGLASWRAEPALGTFLAVLFLRTWGVFEYLERFKSPSAADDGRQYSPILSWSSADDTETLAEFLAAAYVDLAALPGALRQGLRRRWVEVLKDWAGQAAGAGEHRDAIVSLLRALLVSDRAGVGSEVLRLLRLDPLFTRPGSELAALAIDALTAPRTRPGNALSQGTGVAK